MVLMISRNLVKLSYASLLSYTTQIVMFFFRKAVLTNLLKSLISIVSGKGLRVGS